MEGFNLGLTCGLPTRAIRKTSDGDTPCFPWDRTACPSHPDRTQKSDRTSRPKYWCPPYAACTHRGPTSRPFFHPVHADCHSACGRAPPCFERKLPTAAILSFRYSRPSLPKNSCLSRSRLRFRVLFGIGHGSPTHPGSVLPGAHPGRKALSVARPVAADHLPEFLPIDRTIVVVTAGLVPLQIRVR